jgi:hypothetical protein
MATALFPNGILHPVRTLQTRWFKRASHSTEENKARQNTSEQCLPADGAQSEDRLERIAAYARSGYFHVAYTAGMYVVPLDVPPT